jgi:hypothetical protein
MLLGDPSVKLYAVALTQAEFQTLTNPYAIAGFNEVQPVSKFKTVLSLALAVLLVSFPSPPLNAFPATSAPSSRAPSWPKAFDRNGEHIVVYQPQVRSWRGYRSLIADTAISLTQPGGQPILGVISWHADTITDVSSHTVFVKDIEVVSSRFPSLDAVQEAVLQQRFRQVYPTMTFTISLDRMIASVEKVNAPAQAIAVNPQPPPIFVATTPSILLLVEGKPVLAPIQGTTLQYVVNTNWDLFYDNSNYFLLNSNAWLKAKELSGPWAVTTKLPPDMAKLPTGQNWGDVLKAVPAPASAGAAPKVWFTDKPAELIVFKGSPAYAKIPGTSLQYAANTESNVFQHSPDNQVYVLLSGRWFRAATLEGPWTFAGNDLPMDFSRLPKKQSYSSVLASVPGTQEASDAVLLAQVPTTAIVNRAQAEAQVKVSYAGEPQFVPIESTTMFYAANTPNKVIRIGNLYYLCYQGIWFISTTSSGPWKTADSVPAVIYTIPPASPVYNVTYVVVSNPTPTTVEMSYSAGYMGMFVMGMAIGATVVYGTGYYYPPYVYWGPRPIYYPYPYTYGCAAVYNPYTGFYAVGRSVYGPYGSAGSAAWYNPATGMYGHAVTTQNAYGGHTYASGYNPWTGTSWSTSQGHNQYGSWGSTVVNNGNNWAEAQHNTNANGTTGSFQTSKGSAGAGFSGANGNSGFVAKDANNNNVYAGADGNVYKKDSNGNWSKYSDGGWTPVNPTTAESEAKTNAQNKKSGNQAAGSSNNLGSSSGAGNSANPNRPDSSASDSTRSQRGAGQTPPAQTAPNQPPATTPGSSGTMGQLQNDAGSRERGDQLEQNRGAGRGAARGSGGGARRRP